MKDKVKKEKTKVDKKEKVKLNSEKIRERDKKIEVIKTGLLIMTLFLIVVYFLLVSFYEGGNFTISLDPDFAQKSGLVIYENNSEDDKRILKATSARAEISFEILRCSFAMLKTLAILWTS